MIPSTNRRSFSERENRSMYMSKITLPPLSKLIVVLFVQGILPIAFNKDILYCISLIVGVFTFYTGFHYFLGNLNQLKIVFKNE